jgi:hydroxymethylglutaryl-CoA reductase
MPVGLVGGATKVHPTAQALIKLLGVTTAKNSARSLWRLVWRRTLPPAERW